MGLIEMSSSQWEREVLPLARFFCFMFFQFESNPIFYIYFVFQMFCISEILCIFARNLRNMVEIPQTLKFQ